MASPLSLFSLLVFVYFGEVFATPTLGPVLAENLIAPLNIATATPRFSWTLIASSPDIRGTVQSGYALSISSDSAGLVRVFDSGYISSPRQSLVAGPGAGVLSSGSVYFYNVSVWTSVGGEAQGVSTSPLQRLSIGLLSLADWSAPTFIGLGMASAPVPPPPAGAACPWLRRDFNLSAADARALSSGAASALFFIASIGYHEVYVNGAKAAPQSVLAPGVSDLGRRILSRAYDVAPLLAAGANTLGLWVAPGWSAFEGVNPVMNFNVTNVSVAMGELRIRAMGPGGKGLVAVSPTTIVTDGSWLARPSSTTHAGLWTSSNFGGDVIDWGQDDPNWASPNGSTASASSSSSLKWVPAATFAPPPGRLISPEAIEPNVVVEVIPAASIAPCTGTAPPPGCFVVTMARLFTGWLRVAPLPAAAAAHSNLTFSHSANAGVTVEFNQVDYAHLGGAGAGDGGSCSALNAFGPVSFCGRFSYHEIQYITVQGFPPAAPPPPLSAFEGLRLRDARSIEGAFFAPPPPPSRSIATAASPPPAAAGSGATLLETIFNVSLYTYEGLSLAGVSVDCPHRERLGYGGDAHGSLEFVTATFGASVGPFYRKWMLDWTDVQGWDGGGGDLPHTAPTVDGGGGPAWGGFSVLAPAHLYDVTGDVQALAEAYPTAAAFLRYLRDAHVNASSGLLAPYGGSWGFLGDWLAPWGSDASGSPGSILFNNAYLVFAARRGAAMATALGLPSDAAEFEALAAGVGAAVHAAFFDAATGRYLRGYQTDQALPLAAGLVPAADRPIALAALAEAIRVNDGGHVNTGIHGSYFLAKLLSDPAVNKELPEAGTLLVGMLQQTTFPSYGYLLSQNYTTWPETWPGATSRLHACLLGYALVFSQYILGVRVDPAYPGFTNFTVAPAYGVGSIVHASGAVATPFGPVALEWWLASSGNVTISIQIPIGAVARLWLPATGPAQVTESGAPAVDAKGVSYLGLDGANQTIWGIVPGNFVFCAIDG